MITYRLHDFFLLKRILPLTNFTAKDETHPSNIVFSNDFIVRTFHPFLLTLSSLKREKLAVCAQGQLNSFTDKTTKYDGKH